MIDFRYHLVSLISVFLALAVGIVLGAGPLRESLGAQLASQVEQLRTEKDDLRTEADNLRAQNDQLAGFISEVGPDLVDSTLQDNDLVVISDHPSTQPQVQALTGLLGDADARSVTHVAMQPSLWDPAAEQRSTDAVEAVSSIAPMLLDPSLDETEQLPALIVTLLTQDSSSEVTAELRSQVWQVLIDHDLVTVEGGIPPRASAVVYAAAEGAQLIVDSDDDAIAADRAEQLLRVQTRLLTTLTTTQTPAVLSAVTPDNDGTVGILRSVRGDSRFSEISTTDRLQAADGPVLSVLAVIEQLRGEKGDYGTTVDAESRVPDLPETAPIDEELQDPDSTGETAPSDAGGEE